MPIPRKPQTRPVPCGGKATVLKHGPSVPALAGEPWATRERNGPVPGSIAGAKAAARVSDLARKPSAPAEDRAKPESALNAAVPDPERICVHNAPAPVGNSRAGIDKAEVVGTVALASAPTPSNAAAAWVR